MTPCRLVLLAFAIGGCTTPIEAASIGPMPDPTTDSSAAVTTCATTTDYNADPLNCGTCGNVCASGLCYAGVCADNRAGHIFVVGNSYRKSNPSWDRVFGNALFLKESAKVNIVVYRGTAGADYNNGVANAIVRAAALMHRTYVRMILTS